MLINKLTLLVQFHRNSYTKRLLAKKKKERRKEIQNRRSKTFSKFRKKSQTNKK